MKELKDLVAGDKVVAYDKYDNRRIAIVERITKTLVVANNIKYRKSDGFASGESYIFSCRIEIPKDEWIQKQSNRTDLIESMKYNLEQYNKSVVAAEKDTQWLKTFSESIKKVTE